MPALANRTADSSVWGSPAWKILVRRDLEALREHPSGTAAQHRWMFPWGMVEADHMDTIISQVEDIYLHDTYRFTPFGPAPRIIDGGGNIGLSAIWFRNAYPDADITVYEPDPVLVRRINANLAHAGADRVRIEPLALWSSAGQLSFSDSGDDRGHLDTAGALTVSTADIALVVGDGVDLLKLDIEGAECECLEHLLQTHTVSRVQRIAAELHMNQANTDRMLAILQGLRAHGFSLAFHSQIAGWLGVESPTAPFAAVGRGKTFIQLFAWQDHSA